MFNFIKPLDLPPQLKWKYANEPELLGWTIRARNYGTFIANIFFSLFASIVLGASLEIYSTFDNISEPWRTLLAAGFFSAFTLLGWSGFGQRVNIAYRFAKSGWEYCKWKDTPKWHLTAVKWITGLMVVVSLYLITIDPSFIIGALLGPGGMAITYLAMANSENYQSLQTEYNHITFEWNEIHEGAIATNREVVDLKYHRAAEGEARPPFRNVNIFCRQKQKDAVANFIKGHLPPEAPFIRAKLNTMMKTE